MSELETVDDFEIEAEEVAEQPETEEVEEESAEAPEGEPESAPGGDEQEPEGSSESERFVKRINKKHRQMMEEKERADALEKRIQELEAKSSLGLPPDIPDVDPYSDEFEAQKSARDRAIAEKARWEAKQELITESKEKAKKEQQQAEQEKFAKSVTSFMENGKKYGLTEAAVSEAAGALSAMGFPQELGRMLIDDPDGAAIITHLASNPDLAEKLSTVGSYSAAMMIEREVRSKALGSFKAKPKGKPAPEPDEPITRSSATADSPLLKGATFE